MGSKDRQARYLIAPGHPSPRWQSNIRSLAAMGTLFHPTWASDAACREHPEVNFFPERGESTVAAKLVCAGCLVRAECQAYAETLGPKLVGIWGGLSQRERKMSRRPVRAPAA